MKFKLTKEDCIIPLCRSIDSKPGFRLFGWFKPAGEDDQSVNGGSFFIIYVQWGHCLTWRTFRRQWCMVCPLLWKATIAMRYWDWLLIMLRRHLQQQLEFKILKGEALLQSVLFFRVGLPKPLYPVLHRIDLAQVDSSWGMTLLTRFRICFFSIVTCHFGWCRNQRTCSTSWMIIVVMRRQYQQVVCTWKHVKPYNKTFQLLFVINLETKLTAKLFTHPIKSFLFWYSPQSLKWSRGKFWKNGQDSLLFDFVGFYLMMLNIVLAAMRKKRICYCLTCFLYSHFCLIQQDFRYWNFRKMKSGKKLGSILAPRHRPDTAALLLILAEKYTLIYCVSTLFWLTVRYKWFCCVNSWYSNG